MGEKDSEIKRLADAVEDRTEAIDKTLDASTQIARSLEELVAHQDHRYRFQQLNSFVAYLLFTVLLGGGFYILYKSRSEALIHARDQAIAGAEEARLRARELQDSQVERKSSAQAAADFYKLVRDGRHSDVIAGYPEVEKLKLSEVERMAFEDALARAKASMVDAGYVAGVEAFRRSDYEAATAELRRGLAYADEGERVAQMRYYLGLSLAKQGSEEEAVHELELAIAGGVEQAGIDDARFHLANTLVQHGSFDEAREAYTKFANKYPNHRFAQMARRKAAELLRAARERARMARETPEPQAPEPVVAPDPLTSGAGAAVVP